MYLEKLFAFIDLIGGKTNKSCGFHVNISISDAEKMKMIDPLKLTLLSNDAKWAATFGRARNFHCETLAFKRRCKTVDDLKKEFYRTRFKYKYVSVNFAHRSHVEFRVLGNAGYEKRLPEIKTAINDFVAAVNDSVTRNRDLTYRRRLHGLLRARNKEQQ
jgi:hypothetical protein